MISAGRSVTDNTTPLAKVTIEYLYKSVCNPRDDMAAMIRQLRLVRALDAKRYASAKRQLPYVCCGIFNPPHRHGSNFAHISHFIIDIDHLSAKGLTPQQVKDKLAADERVALMYVSPSEDGVKVLFNLAQRCSDAGLYSLFYKAFAREFAIRHGLEQVLDPCTSDVARACFVSSDPQAYFNPDAQPVEMDSYINLDNTAELMALKDSDKKKPIDGQNLKASNADAPHDMPHDPDDEAMERIKRLLGNGTRSTRPQKAPVTVPQELTDIMPALQQRMEQHGITLYETINIQYGKKLRLRLGAKLAEINLFYGKRGFSVVQSPRCGTSPQLNELASQLIVLELTSDINGNAQ